MIAWVDIVDSSEEVLAIEAQVDQRLDPEGDVKDVLKTHLTLRVQLVHHFRTLVTNTGEREGQSFERRERSVHLWEIVNSKLSEQLQVLDPIKREVCHSIPAHKVNGQVQPFAELEGQYGSVGARYVAEPDGQVLQLRQLAAHGIQSVDLNGDKRVLNNQTLQPNPIPVGQAVDDLDVGLLAVFYG